MNKSPCIRLAAACNDGRILRTHVSNSLIFTAISSFKRLYLVARFYSDDAKIEKTFLRDTFFLKNN
jgi:hypothetical protein